MPEFTFTRKSDGARIRVWGSDKDEAVSALKENPGSFPTVIKEREDGAFLSLPDGETVVFAPNGEGSYVTDPDAVRRMLNDDGIGPDTAMNRTADEQTAIDREGMIDTGLLANVMNDMPFLGPTIEGATAKMLEFGGVTNPLERLKNVRESYAEEHPWMAAGANAAGTVASVAALPHAARQAGMNMVGRALGPGGVGSQMLRAFPFGAAVGGGQAAVESATAPMFDPDTSFGEELSRRAGPDIVGGAVGGAIGVPVGKLAGLAAKKVGKAGGDIARALGFENDFGLSPTETLSKNFGLSDDAAKIVADALEETGDMSVAAARVREAGERGVLADAGAQYQALLDAVNAASPQAAAVSETALKSRVGESAQALEGTLDATLGRTPLGERTALANINATNAGPRADAFNRALATKIDPATPEGQAVANVVRMIPADIKIPALKEANLMLELDGFKPIEFDPKTGIPKNARLEIQQYDAIKQGLDKAYRDAREVTGSGYPKETPKSRKLYQVRSNLNQALKDANNDYRAAMDEGADTIVTRESFELGNRVLDPDLTPEDVLLDFASSLKTPGQREAAKQGVRYQIDRILGEVKQGAASPTPRENELAAETYKRLSSGNTRAKLRGLVGDREADAILKEVDEVGVHIRTLSNVTGNSKTASRQAVARGIDDVTGRGTFTEALTEAKPVEAARRVVAKALAKDPAAERRETRAMLSEVAQFMTTMQPGNRTADAALRVIRQSLADNKPLGEGQRKLIEKAVTLYVAAQNSNKE